MSDRSAIEWTDATWNPVRGCTKVSPGCRFCYAELFAERFRGVPGHPFAQGFDLRLVLCRREDGAAEGAFREPRARKPLMVLIVWSYLDTAGQLVKRPDPIEISQRSTLTFNEIAPHATGAKVQLLGQRCCIDLPPL